MFCGQCGTAIQPGQRYCSGCGRLIGTAPVMAPQSRLAGNLRTLGILWMIISGLRLIPGVILMTIFQVGASFLPADVPFFVPALVRGIGMFILAAAAIGFFAGWGLLDRQPWARTLALVLGFLSLIEFPLGTAIGVYTLWVLLPADAGAEYRQLSLSDLAR